ncbi:SDR family oxidoreductase [Echinicola sp. CAU 1574]|uniref:SDR family oxidoreductase n=1 Tax=Echinicola arenosa TaxID=2774144 RepID=A0ABR9APG2_9BACT|nr:SDR family oxidoreductase [Echinicola arenosa]MBD8490681.1 SDR family oxidoreductase [Echinicola arenosa]
MKKTLITGATGELGSLIINFLSKKASTSDIAVLVRDTQSEKARQYATQGFDVRQGDYNDPDSLIKAFEGIEQLFLVSGNDIEARIKQHETVIKSAIENQVEHILYTSTVRKVEDSSAPLFPVVNSHRLTEESIIASGMNYTILRHNLYAEVIPLFIGGREQILQTKNIFLPSENGKCNFVARKDLAEAEANILAEPEQHKNKIYEFNGNEALDFETISELLSEILKARVTYHSPDINTFESTMENAGLPSEIIGMLAMFSMGIASGEFEQDKSDLEIILGRKAQSIKTFIQGTYD